MTNCSPWRVLVPARACGARGKNPVIEPALWLHEGEHRQPSARVEGFIVMFDSESKLFGKKAPLGPALTAPLE